MLGEVFVLCPALKNYKCPIRILDEDLVVRSESSARYELKDGSCAILIMACIVNSCLKHKRTFVRFSTPRPKRLLMMRSAHCPSFAHDLASCSEETTATSGPGCRNPAQRLLLQLYMPTSLSSAISQVCLVDAPR
jgi:hypothetical protein